MYICIQTYIHNISCVLYVVCICDLCDIYGVCDLCDIYGVCDLCVICGVWYWYISKVLVRIYVAGLIH